MSDTRERLKLVFCGTPQFAVPTLEALLAAGHDVALVVSQPDRPVGRAQTTDRAAGEADSAGRGHWQSRSRKRSATIRNFARSLRRSRRMRLWWSHTGALFRRGCWQLPRLGCINLHGSLLPKYRGAAPIQWAVANGDAVTGNTTMLLDDGLDTGPILLEQTREIGPDETAVQLFDELAKAGAPLVIESLAGLAGGSIQPRNAESMMKRRLRRC